MNKVSFYFISFERQTNADTLIKYLLCRSDGNELQHVVFSKRRIELATFRKWLCCRHFVEIFRHSPFLFFLFLIMANFRIISLHMPLHQRTFSEQSAVLGEILFRLNRQIKRSLDTLGVTQIVIRKLICMHAVIAYLQMTFSIVQNIYGSIARSKWPFLDDEIYLCGLCLFMQTDKNNGIMNKLINAF